MIVYGGSSHYIKREEQPMYTTCFKCKKQVHIDDTRRYEHNNKINRICKSCSDVVPSTYVRSYLSETRQCAMCKRILNNDQFQVVTYKTKNGIKNRYYTYCRACENAIKRASLHKRKAAANE